jgi:hypothetical protein
MATLRKLYATLNSLREMNMPVNDQLLRAVDELEEKIIKEEILPVMSKNIEPLLGEIQRNLVLVVEYHPGEPISVTLTRKIKISEVVDAKHITQVTNRIVTPVSGGRTERESREPTRSVVNATKGMRVTFPDGTVICRRYAIDTFIDVLRKIGLHRIPAVRVMHSGYNLVSKEKREEQPDVTWQHECDGWYIYSNISNSKKCDDLQMISDYYHLHLKIEEGR